MLFGAAGCGVEPGQPGHVANDARGPATAGESQGTALSSGDRIVKTDAEWRATLTPNQYLVLREQGTEPARTGEYEHMKEPGTYVCAGCGQALFSSDAKYDSGSGWPSFWEPIDEGHVETETDRRHGTVRTEVHCSRCAGHLGHIFEDGPRPTGLRYCINSVSLKHVPEGEGEAEE